MDLREVEQLIDNAIGRTRIVAGMDKSQVRRAAKLEVLRLAEADIKATLEAMEV